MAGSLPSAIARAAGRDYITPEDVDRAHENGAAVDAIRLDVLRVLGDVASLGAEDGGLCAFAAADLPSPPSPDPAALWALVRRWEAEADAKPRPDRTYHHGERNKARRCATELAALLPPEGT